MLSNWQYWCPSKSVTISRETEVGTKYGAGFRRRVAARIIGHVVRGNVCRLYSRSSYCKLIYLAATADSLAQLRRAGKLARSEDEVEC